MRAQLALLVLALTGSRERAETLAKVDRIEMRESGWSAVDVQINSRGEGHYQLSNYPQERRGSFSISPQQFAALITRLERFRSQAQPMTDESVERMLDARCPQGVAQVTDAGAFWIRWVGPDYERHYSAEFGCDFERNRARNDELRSILRSLPIDISK